MTENSTATHPLGATYPLHDDTSTGYAPAPAAKPSFADRLRTPVAGAVLSGVVVLGVGFGAGFLVGKDAGATTSVVGTDSQGQTGQTVPGQTGQGQTGQTVPGQPGQGQTGGGLGGVGGLPGQPGQLGQLGQAQDGTQVPGTTPDGTTQQGTTQDGGTTTT